MNSIVEPAVTAEENKSLISARVNAEDLGSQSFKKDYNTRYAYVSGSMYKAIASKELVVRMGKAGLIGFYGTGGIKPDEVERSIQYIQRELNEGQSYGMNLLCQPATPAMEMAAVDLFLRYGVRFVEASAFMQMTPALVKYRLKGLTKDNQGNVISKHKIIAKISRPEVAQAFLSPAPEAIVNKLVEAGQVTAEEANLAKNFPMADDLCAEADSGGHTDGGVAFAMLPSMARLRDRMCQEFGYNHAIRVGASGGIGAPEAAASAFIMGADFIVTGSINQCTVEAGTSDRVKDMLQQLDIQDTEYAPAGDMFELGAKVQVMKRGVFFPARANKLYDLWRYHNSLDEIDEKTIKQLEKKFFKRSISEVYAETKAYYEKVAPEELAKAEANPKQKMSLIFRWYFVHTTRLAMSGSDDQVVDYQVHTGPAMGAFNQWVKGTELEDWRQRHVDVVAEKLMLATADVLSEKLKSYLKLA